MAPQTQQLWQFPSDASLEAWTSSASTALRTLVSVSHTPLAIPPAFLASSFSSAPVTIKGGETVPHQHVARIVKHLDNLKFSPLVSLLLSKLPVEDIVADVLYLSGEEQVGATDKTSWVSRHSMSEGGHKASDWLLGRFRAYGFECEQHQYRFGFAPMVECVKKGETRPEEHVVIGAHFDSRGVSTSGMLIRELSS